MEGGSDAQVIPSAPALGHIYRREAGGEGGGARSCDIRALRVGCRGWKLRSKQRKPRAAESEKGRTVKDLEGQSYICLREMEPGAHAVCVPLLQ